MSSSHRSVSIGLLAMGLAACAPMPITYYQPSAEGAEVAWARCDQAPPYMAKWSSANLTATADFGVFEPSTLVLSFTTAASSSIELDPAGLIIMADGRPVALDRLSYWATSSTDAKEARGPLKVVANSLQVEVIVPKEPEELAVTVPALIVNGEPIAARSVRFHREKKVKLRFLVLNC